ncbi:hypothetical protein E1B28_013621 [Marasmius oreades]|uniref:Uncharacterized protein n=1 Tax=Marasmius oreades TaxID=181124 RepID=A0A9P7RRD1_9AGAR|nr:uncharacterized protein E1B28_013621 [Marasmius oreades]KAG7087673.1 hypothetical protein E1B28_013621 [Marasmius oreades]
MKRIEVDNIALEARTELLHVEIDNGPILGKTMATNAESDGWGAEDLAKDEVAHFAPIIFDLMEELSMSSYGHLHGVQKRPSPFFLSLSVVIAVLPLLDLLLRSLSTGTVPSDGVFDRLEELGVDSLAK